MESVSTGGSPFAKSSSKSKVTAAAKATFLGLGSIGHFLATAVRYQALSRGGLHLRRDGRGEGPDGHALGPDPSR